VSISAENTPHESVAAQHVAAEPTPEEAAQLEQLYRDFDRENLIPLWTEIADLMPMVPSPKAVPHVWRWSDLYPLAAGAGALVPVCRGGERRAIALANPGLAGTT
jgi:gentisate 1,2-dioxygenase